MRVSKATDRYMPVQNMIAKSKKKPKKKAAPYPRMQLPEEKFEIHAIEDMVETEDGITLIKISFRNHMPKMDLWYMEEALLLDVTREGLNELIAEYKDRSFKEYHGIKL
jgi:hypothetical protein